ncbi:MAG: MFS transporter, partial [Gemmatimonadaceae bacterium]
VSIAAVLGLALFGSIFVLPIFLQNLHGLTANQTGMVILPGAIASAVTMAFVGKNANKLDARATVAVGAMLFFVSMWMLARMTLASGPGETFWPLILRGVGLGLIFVPLTNASMADVKDTELAQGTGMFNLTRQLGGSMGIAIMATMLTRFTAQKKALISEHVTTMDPGTLGRLDSITRGLIAHGANPISAKQQALALLDHQIQAQASVLAFSRIYILSGVILLCSLPLLFLFRTGKGRGAMGPVH